MENRNTFNLLFFAIKKRVNKKGEIPLYMRITINGKKTEMSMHRSIDAKLWNTSSGSAIGNTKISKDINNYIMSVQTSIYDYFKSLREKEIEITPSILKNRYLGIKEDNGKKVIQLYQEHNDKIKKLINIDYSPDTVQRYETSLRHTQEFIKQKYKKDDLYLEELNNEFIVDYEVYFKTVRKCSHNTTMKYIKNFKKIIRIAIANGHLTIDPFANFKLTLKKVDKGFLTEEQLDTLINKKMATKRLEQVRDCFVFSCFTGLAHSDLKLLSPKNIVIGTDGAYWIKTHRKKTGNSVSIPIFPISQRLIDKYKTNEICLTQNVLLPVLSNQKMNAYLKEIAEVCDIPLNLTSHIARHTFATTVTLNNNVSIESVSKMLGHSSISMTKIYARLLDKRVGHDTSHLHDKFDIEI
ncbi:MAG: site-specific integrase [Bacteroidales bacterium]|nr:site-specific integrase [Bacteroidales bacterium]